MTVVCSVPVHYPYDINFSSGVSSRTMKVPGITVDTDVPVPSSNPSTDHGPPTTKTRRSSSQGRQQLHLSLSPTSLTVTIMRMTAPPHEASMVRMTVATSTAKRVRRTSASRWWTLLRLKWRRILLRLAVVSIMVAVLPPFAIVTASSSTAAGTETLIGIVGRDFVLLGADSSLSRSIVVTASNLDKISVLVDPFPSGHQQGQADDDGRQALRPPAAVVAVAAAGDSADSDRLVGALQAHTTLREFEVGIGSDVALVDCSASASASANGVGPASTTAWFPSPEEANPTVHDVAHLARNLIAQRMRSRRPLQVCLLVAGLAPQQHPPSQSQSPLPLPSMIADVEDSTDNNNLLAPSTPHYPFVWRPSSSSSSSSSTITAEECSRNRDANDLQRQVQRSSDALAGASSATGVAASTTDRRERDPKPLVHPPPLSSSSMASSSSSLRPHLYWLDEYGSLSDASNSYAVHGLGAHFVWSVLDRRYHPLLTKTDALHLMRECFDQLQTRYAVNAPNPPCIKLLDQHGCRRIPTNVQTLGNDDDEY